MRRIGVLALLAGLAMLVMAAPASARHHSSLLDLIPLPTGWQPEGIAIDGKTAYVGSIPTGAVWRVDLRTGEGAPAVQPQTGRAAVGLKIDKRDRLWVAGGPTGQAYVYDADTGDTLATYQLAPDATTFVNDVVLTKRAAWFTDSQRPVLYRIPIHPHGVLAAQSEVQTVQLTGDYVHQPGFNLNGIEATRSGRTLIVVQSNTGFLFAVDAKTGVTRRIALGGGDQGLLPNGDGLLLDHKTLYVVQNQLNKIAVVNLDRGLRSGTIVTELTDPDFAVPTTIDDVGKRIYAVNARFDVPEADRPNAAYSIASVEKPFRGRGDCGDRRWNHRHHD